MRAPLIFYDILLHLRKYKLWHGLRAALAAYLVLLGQQFSAPKRGNTRLATTPGNTRLDPNTGYTRWLQTINTVDTSIRSAPVQNGHAVCTL